MTLKQSFSLSYLLLGLEHITAEHIALSISGNVAEDLQILGVMRHVEDPKRKENRSETKKSEWDAKQQQNLASFQNAS